MAVVAVIYPDESGYAYMRSVLAHSPRMGCSLAFEETEYNPLKGTIALLAWNGAFTYLAGLQRGSKADDIRRKFELRLISEISPPLPIAELQSALLASQRRPTERPGGTLTSKATGIVIDYIRSWRPQLEDVLNVLIEGSASQVPGDRLGVIAEEREAIATLLDIANLEPNHLLEEEEVDFSGRVTFLPPNQAGTPIEDPMVNHDSGTFLGWSPRNTDRLGVRAFTNGAGKTLHVMNVNRWGIETSTGADLLYYHIQRRSFVLVQYKRMTPEGKHWRYRPDDQLDKQLAAMRRLDAACEAEPRSEFRLLAAPSFVKLCRLENLVVDSLSLVPGMYLAAGQVDAHLADPGSRGPGGGQYFSFDNVRSYMTNTLFTELVAHGFLGTSETSTALVVAEIEASLARRQSTIVGLLDDPVGRRPGWSQPATVV